jgi:integrase
MALRQRTWAWKGRERTAWIVDYSDAKGKRRLKTFRTKRAALDWDAGTRIDLKHGTHVADADSITIEAAGRLWLASCEANRLERSTREQYRQHVELHIKPLIGATKLNKLTLPAVRTFQDRLRESGRSSELTRKLLTSLGSLVADAQERGLTARNPMRERKRRSKATARHKKRLVVGVDNSYPRRDPHAPERRHGPLARIRRHGRVGRTALVRVARPGVAGCRLCGRRHHRASALRCLGELGSPKAATSRRTIPVPQLVVNALKEWKLACPKATASRSPNWAGRARTRKVLALLS